MRQCLAAVLHVPGHCEVPRQNTGPMDWYAPPLVTCVVTPTPSLAHWEVVWEGPLPAPAFPATPRSVSAVFNQRSNVPSGDICFFFPPQNGIVMSLFIYTVEHVVALDAKTKKLYSLIAVLAPLSPPLLPNTSLHHISFNHGGETFILKLDFHRFFSTFFMMVVLFSKKHSLFDC